MTFPSMSQRRRLSSLRWKLCLPEYFLRPRQILLRWRRKLAGGLSHSVPGPIANLPWGLSLRLTTPELIQNAIWLKGVYDVVLTETIWRLLDDGDTAIDVGAHIGYMSSVMAARVGAQGRVLAFEPHPDLFRELAANVSLWAGYNGVRSEEHTSE